jgi:hypothetical protein
MQDPFPVEAQQKVYDALTQPTLSVEKQNRPRGRGGRKRRFLVHALHKPVPDARQAGAHRRIGRCFPEIRHAIARFCGTRFGNDRVALRQHAFMRLVADLAMKRGPNRELLPNAPAISR